MVFFKVKGNNGGLVGKICAALVFFCIFVKKTKGLKRGLSATSALFLRRKMVVVNAYGTMVGHFTFISSGVGMLKKQKQVLSSHTI